MSSGTQAVALAESLIDDALPNLRLLRSGPFASAARYKFFETRAASAGPAAEAQDVMPKCTAIDSLYIH
jgi:hypothetical protein